MSTYRLRTPDRTSELGGFRIVMEALEVLALRDRRPVDLEGDVA